MKKYVKSLIQKLIDGYKYYKELSQYTQKQSKFKFINFIKLIWYIIFKEVSIFLKFKIRIMNLLDAQKLIAKAQQYLGREITVPTTDLLGKKVDVAGIFTEIKTLVEKEGTKLRAIPLGKLVATNNPNKYEPVLLSDIVKAFGK